MAEMRVRLVSSSMLIDDTAVVHPPLRSGGALTLRVPLHDVQRYMRYRRGIVLALQVVADGIAGNVSRGRVVVNLQVAADVVVIDRRRGGVVVDLEIVADRVAGTGICVVGTDFDGARSILDE